MFGGLRAQATLSRVSFSLYLLAQASQEPRTLRVVGSMRGHRCCTRVFLCTTAPPLLAYLALAVGAALALAGVLAGGAGAREGAPRPGTLDWAACVGGLAAAAALAALAAAACVAQRKARCCGLLQAYGVLTLLLGLALAAAASLLAAVVAHADGLRSGEDDGTLLGGWVDGGLAWADRACCRDAPDAWTCYPVRDACAARGNSSSLAPLLRRRPRLHSRVRAWASR